VAEFDIVYGKGISREGEVLDLGVDHDAVEKRGSYYYYQDDMMAQGRENTKQFLQQNPEITSAIETAIREMAFEAPEPSSNEDAEQEEEETA
jgi:recombination protein RecA